MMVVLDVNLLLATFLDGHPMHAKARAWLIDLLDTSQVVVPDVVWAGLARIATNPQIVTPPATWADVASFIVEVRAEPACQVEVRAMTSPLEVFLAICQAGGATGNKVSDAYIAAIAMENGASVATWDNDFKEFPVPLETFPLAP